MEKIILAKPTPWPLGYGLMRPTGTVLDVLGSEADELRARGLVAEPAPVADPVVPVGEATGLADEVPSKPRPSGKMFGPLPKKTASVNVWREYARENEIDVRGLSEKSELIGHITKVAAGQ